MDRFGSPPSAPGDRDGYLEGLVDHDFLPDDPPACLRSPRYLISQRRIDLVASRDRLRAEQVVDRAS